MTGVILAGGSGPPIAQHEALVRLRWAAFCLMAYLLFTMIGFTPLQDDSLNAQVSDGTLINQVTAIGLMILLMVTTWHRGQTGKNLAVPVPVLVLIAYCLVTVAWSMVPDIALRRLALMGITMWVLFRAVGELGYRWTLRCLRVTMVILLAANYLAVALFEHGIHHFRFGVFSTEIGSWRGIMLHKNIAGSASALTALLFIFDRRDVPRAFANATLLAVLAFLFFTQSKASMSGLAVAVMTGFAIRFIQFDKGSGLAIKGLLALMVLMPLAAIYYGDAMAQLDDPDGFTGRMQIWVTLLAYARDHFWTGTGFSSFWHVGDASPVLALTHGWVAEVAPAGHNGYLDLLVTIGFPGLVLAVMMLLILPAQRLLWSQAIPLPCRSLLFSLMVFCVCNNLAESQLLDGKSVDQMFLTMVIAMIGLAAPVSRPMPGGVSSSGARQGMMRGIWQRLQR